MGQESNDNTDDIQILNLDVPGKLWASTQHEQDNTFYIVTPEDKYTKESLSDNPAVDPPHMLMAPFIMPFGQADANGVVTLDLKATGKGKEILAALDRIYQDGGNLPDKVKALIVATAKDGNKIPAKQLAAVMELQLAQLHEVRLKAGTRSPVAPDYVTADAWKKGTVDFVVEITPHGVDTVDLSTAAGKVDIWTDDGKQKGKTITLDTKGKDDQPIIVHVGVLFTKSQEQRAVYHPQITYSWDYWKPAFYSYDKRDVITGEDVVLKLVGKGRTGDPVNKAITLKSEAWAAQSDWMIDKSSGPPNVYYHPHC